MVLVFISCHSGALWLCFLGVAKCCEASLLLTPVSILSVVVVRFDTGEGWVRSMIEAYQSLVLSFCGEETEHGGTKKVVLGDY